VKSPLQGVIYWIQAPGQLSDDQTAFDYAVLIMEERIGEVVGYPGYRAYNDSWNGGDYWQYIGYPGELSNGERPACQMMGSFHQSGRRAPMARPAMSWAISTSSHPASLGDLVGMAGR
jgi:hypothetical protein